MSDKFVQTISDVNFNGCLFIYLFIYLFNFFAIKNQKISLFHENLNILNNGYIR